jgi:Tol biopolymer transport system component
MDATTGKVSPIATDIPLTYQGPFWSPDGLRIYYQPNDGSIREVETTSGNERVIVPAPTTWVNLGHISLSPDGRWIARYGRTADGSLQSIVILSLEDGQSRELLRLSDGQFDIIPMPWTPDSRAVLARKGRRELWLVPINGEAPRKLDIDLGPTINGQLGKIRLSPDGKHLAFVVGTSYRNETWVLENFLPARAAK